MNQAVVNPEELRRFAQMLKKFNTDLVEQSASISRQLHALNNSWRDQENRKFCETFQQHLQVLNRFAQENEEHVPYLLRKAERIEEYLQQR